MEIFKPLQFLEPFVKHIDKVDNPNLYKMSESTNPTGVKRPGWVKGDNLKVVLKMVRAETKLDTIKKIIKMRIRTNQAEQEDCG